MTIGHLLECVVGKVACCTGERGDATPFCGADDKPVHEQLAEKLAEYGHQQYGREVM
jgi:DNA-directed RNA polymerase II subunit RPB2